MKQLIILLVAFTFPLFLKAQKVTINVINQPASVVFRSIIEQTGKNFVYSSEILKDMKITVKAHKQPLKKVLNDIFRGTDIEYKIKGNNVILKQNRHNKKPGIKSVPPSSLNPGAIKTAIPAMDTITMLDEVLVLSRLEAPVIETSELGAQKITAEEVKNMPAIFGESDVIKTLQMQPGVSEGSEGLAGMHVHGGNSDENLFSLDNVPLYQVNHFAGLFSAFNTDIIHYIDFFKTSIPAKYDGRLSSFMDVRLRNGRTDGHHGSARIGLTSGAFNLSGPIGKRTTYLVGLRRSWYDLLTIPILAIVNSKAKDEKMRFQYAFMDFNLKVNHKFSSDLTGFLSTYYGNDLLKTGWKDNNLATTQWEEDDKYDFNWGNFVVRTGLNYRITPNLTSEFTAAYTRFFSSMKHNDFYKEVNGLNEVIVERHLINKTDNNINDWTFRGDFDWAPSENSHVRFGGNYIRHIFLPERNKRSLRYNGEQFLSTDSTSSYGANEFNAYIEDDWKATDRLLMNTGFHTSLFYIEGKTHAGISPRFSLAYKLNNNVTLKGAYSHTVQYVHQLNMSYLSLPVDQWIPITGKFKPQSADKIAIGGYWQSDNGGYAVSVEGYYKSMHNLVEYRDEYYLTPPLEMWNTRLTSGKGSAKGFDLMLEKKEGKITGHISYSLARADRQFKDKNGGRPFPARFDNRHTINIVANWKASDKVTLNAAWTGHSGNHFTLLSQVWEEPAFSTTHWIADEVPLRAPVNNYQLPFYHRLDLACNVRNKHGFWTFSLYNAYNNRNTVAITRGYKELINHTPEGSFIESIPIFQKVRLLPIIPSISYTWQF